MVPVQTLSQFNPSLQVSQMSNHQSPQALLMSPFNNLNNLSALNLNVQAHYN